MRKKMFLGLMGLGLFSLNVLVFSEGAYASEVLKEADDCGCCSWRHINTGFLGVGKGYEACLKSGDGNSCTCGETTR